MSEHPFFVPPQAFMSRSERYEEAVSTCEVVTLRLRCVNRALRDYAPVRGSLSPDIRRKVRDTLDHHILTCEGGS